MTQINPVFIHELHNASGTISRIKAGYAAQDRRDLATEMFGALMQHPQLQSFEARTEGYVLMFVPGPMPHGILMHRRQGEQLGTFYGRAFTHCERAAARRGEPTTADAAFIRTQLGEMM